MLLGKRGAAWGAELLQGGGQETGGHVSVFLSQGPAKLLGLEARGEGSQAERWWCLRRGKQSPPYGFIALHSLHPQSQGITLTGWEVNGEGKNDYSYFRGE